MKAITIISIFLGATSFMLGILKLVHPFKAWVNIQIAESGLPPLALPLVTAAEIITGLIFLLPFIAGKFSGYKLFFLTTASIVWIIIMAVAIYVHLQPEVPAEVLPLKIKAPYIPLFYIAATGTNLFLIRKYFRIRKAIQ